MKLSTYAKLHLFIKIQLLNQLATGTRTLAMCRDELSADPLNQ